jgi:hypothetical protein
MRVVNPRFLWSLGYLATVALVLAGLFAARGCALETYGTVKAQRDWHAWRNVASRQTGSEPVRRRAPESPQPPALLLMRDHFVACAILAVLLTTVLFATVAVMLSGTLKRSGGKGSGLFFAGRRSPYQRPNGEK